MNKPKRRYNIPVLSGTAYIGQLFDGTTDQLLLDQFFWRPFSMRTKTANITNVRFETTIEEGQNDRMKNFELDDSTKLSFMSGLLKVIGRIVLYFSIAYANFSTPN